MSGNDALKYYREKKGYSIRQLASELKLSARTITYYESGERAISSVPVSKAIEMFKVLDISIIEFFDEYYPYKEDIAKKIQVWRENNPRTLELDILKKRLYLRLAKIKERKSIPIDVLEQIYDQYFEIFDSVHMEMDGEGCISDADYEKHVLPFLYRIKREMQYIPDCTVGKRLVEGMLSKEYHTQDIAEFCGISCEHLIRCMRGKIDFSKIHIDVALKLCYVLEQDIMEVFGEK